MKTCQECFKDIDERATKCPYCQTETGFLASADSFLKSVESLGIFVMFVGILVAVLFML